MNKKILEYCLVSERVRSELEQEVKDKISDGWQPYGFPFIDAWREYKNESDAEKNNNYGNYCQAMVRYE